MSDSTTSINKENLTKRALDYHANPKPGKLGTIATKTMDSESLKLAYTPGVAQPCLAIAKNPEDAYKYTNKGNLIAVISNGTAVLGLGNIGALASKPVMEGKAVLFKHFADLDVFDIELDAKDPDTIVQTIAAISPTFGGINLEDIKAPECFYIEEKLKSMLDIPVFHDDQHGTAVVVTAGLINALKIQGKDIAKVKIVCLGAGAAGIATAKLLKACGATNIMLVDSKGVINHKRQNLNKYKEEVSVNTDAVTLSDALVNADVFIGVSGPGIVNAEQISTMDNKAIVFALSNPDPEIEPQIVRSVLPEAIIATGRSDYPNQINNVLCFPYIFHGALRVKARHMTTAMLKAATYALADLATKPATPEVKASYPDGDSLEFGPNYIIPRPLDARLLEVVSDAVANAALTSDDQDI